MLHGLVWLWAALIVLNIGSAFLTVLDKFRARRRARRIRERTLLGMALIGGSLGLVSAMLLARHKVRKVSFLTRLGVILLLQAALVLYVVVGQRPA